MSDLATSSLLAKATFPLPGSSMRCGVSGGADSLALMALAVAAGCEVTAVHVDHGQRVGSAGEAEKVAEYAHALGAEFESHTVSVAEGSNLEARMRAARYGVLGPHAATGHTADDQAETVLINLVRGSGLTGLGAMRPGHRRPILALRRSETEEVCNDLGWSFLVDPSNADSSFQRNRIRHEVMPLLSEIAGRDVVPLLVRTASHSRDGAEILSAEAAKLDPTNAVEVASAPRAVAAIALQQWIQRESQSEYPVDAASLTRVLAVAGGEAKAAEVNGGWRVSRSRQILKVSAPPSIDSGVRESGSLDRTG